MKKWQAATAALLGALVLLVLGFVFWAFPLLHAAFLLHGARSSGGFRYRFSVELEEKNLSGQQKQAARSLAWLFGGSDPSGLEWEIAGRASEGRAYGKVYCKGGKAPVRQIFHIVKMIGRGMGHQDIKASVAKNLPPQTPDSPSHLLFGKLMVSFRMIAHRSAKAEYPDSLIDKDIVIHTDTPIHRVLLIVVMIPMDVEHGGMGHRNQEGEIGSVEIPAGQD